ncbi:hypothetical protein CN680_09260 [Bacillus pseudomycoides]|uniref:Uncharacterized protein n=2 Tax=Bacillus pseudomycoides TaxID=64104 RepID=A0A2B6RV10_9BACI|nr:hypothetical protein CON97_06700 [Bacillus pseudomycoides]PEI45049.1 hypothetical protein CN620_02990 [Bacillus pseudomycoides]PEJ79521.1 hypothetical protein CN680_09260 [Bacillus pseudomycoides]PEM20026.1 hypothetical protein CN628_04485 [Bacillus pseudomycoides]PEM69783.1 hypothetical protein CN613_10275 [Bacillus pseudomycoides]
MQLHQITSYGNNYNFIVSDKESMKLMERLIPTKKEFDELVGNETIKLIDRKDLHKMARKGYTPLSTLVESDMFIWAVREDYFNPEYVIPEANSFTNKLDELDTEILEGYMTEQTNKRLRKGLAH